MSQSPYREGKLGIFPRVQSFHRGGEFGIFLPRAHIGLGIFPSPKTYVGKVVIVPKPQ